MLLAIEIIKSTGLYFVLTFYFLCKAKNRISYIYFCCWVSKDYAASTRPDSCRCLLIAICLFLYKLHNHQLLAISLFCLYSVTKHKFIFHFHFNQNLRIYSCLIFLRESKVFPVSLNCSNVANFCI